MNGVRWIIFGAIVAVLLGGLVVYSQLTKTTVDVSTIDTNSVIAPSEENGNIGDHVFNDTESDIIMVEYGDFQCPGCGSAHPNVNTLLAEYGDRITFIFRNFPLTSIHPNAKAAAAAAEAAGLQGQYWEMHNLLFENQTSWNTASASERTEIFNGYAESLNLDMGQFETDFRGTSVNSKISFDQALGTKDGVNSTPSFFLNGEPLAKDAAEGLLQGDLTAIKALLDDLLDEE